MNVQLTLTTAHAMPTVRTWMGHSSVHVRQDFQEMEKHFMVGPTGHPLANFNLL